MSSLVGTWDLDSSENFDEYMKELGMNIFLILQLFKNMIFLMNPIEKGVGFILRKAGNSVKIALIIEKNENKWTLNVRSTFKNHDFTSEEGVEVPESI